MTHARLLPWPGQDGKPCRLVMGEGGWLTHLADELEAAQLAMATTVLESAQQYLRIEEATATELRYLSSQLAMALSDVLRVAESRGERLVTAQPITEDKDRFT
jgi:hypothetical protein